MNKSKWFHSIDTGILILRLFLGVRIIYGVMDNILSWDKMMEFSGFLKAMHFPAPTFCAVLSVYAQFISAVLILIGYKTRLASAIMAINFIVALIMAHRNDTIEGMTSALAMLFISLSLFFTGAGRWAIEGRNRHVAQTY